MTGCKWLGVVLLEDVISSNLLLKVRLDVINQHLVHVVLGYDPISFSRTNVLE